MRIFLTGATGFIGSRIVPELLGRGHQVLGLTRSDAGANMLAAAGAEVQRGTLEDLASIRAGAAQADAVIHTAFDHDFSNFIANCEKDRRVIEALGSVLKGSNRSLLITSGTGIGDPGNCQPATEDAFNPHHPNPRIASELAAQRLLEDGVNVSVVRLPQVHDTMKQGLITPYIEISREKGAVAFVGKGQNRWPAAHVLDVAKLYALASNRAEPGARYHAVAEEGIAVRDIAEMVGTGLGLPVISLSPDEATNHFGWLSMFVSFDMPAASTQTRAKLGWEPKGPSLLSDLKEMDYRAIRP
ncbi:NAD-dependent dehydratase [Ochrobactrum sp. P6BS-III]|uniref:SDR family oxidoreductase n=1 Tax=unclassified Ochrobactrum TaxID=239106 RepID=UPI00099356A0|nr:nucleoside-diphosphate-sugar epimerase [Ochrobactrum sp. P6BSIII]OOL14581.1 NAD-dependent dehydratase [Ochrobactrum sp. P6BS-III]